MNGIVLTSEWWMRDVCGRDQIRRSWKLVVGHKMNNPENVNSYKTYKIGSCKIVYVIVSINVIIIDTLKNKF